MLRDVKNDLFHLLNILESIGKTIKYAHSSKTPEEFIFINDQLNYNATLTLLTNISESISKLSDDTIIQLESIVDLKAIKGLRNRIVHDYTGLDSYIIFDIAKFKIESLRNVIEGIVSKNTKNSIFDIDEFNVSINNAYYKNVRFNIIKAS